MFFEDFSPYSPVTHATVLLRRDSGVLSSGFRTAFKTAEDVDLWLRALHQSRLAVLADCDYLVRLSGSSATAVHGWKNHFYRELAKEFYLVRQRGEQDELEKTGKITEPLAPEPQPLALPSPAVGKNFRGDLLGFHYSVHVNARDWREIFTIIRMALSEGWLLQRTYRSIIFGLLPEGFIQRGVELKKILRRS